MMPLASIDGRDRDPDIVTPSPIFFLLVFVELAVVAVRIAARLNYPLVVVDPFVIVPTMVIVVVGIVGAIAVFGAANCGERK
jgi:hypothetical protein